MDRSQHIALSKIDTRAAMDEESRQEKAHEFYQQMITRHTIRDFADAPVPQKLIDQCLLAAGCAPSGANHQPWHFVAVQDPEVKRKIRIAAEEEERGFYGADQQLAKAGSQWLDALKPIGTDDEKPFLETAPWLIAIFAQRKYTPFTPYTTHQQADDFDWANYQPQENDKNYYVSESVGIATGMLITALHQCGLATLTHTPAPMGFLTEILQRPKTEKPFLLLVVGKAAENATVPKYAMHKKSIDDLRSIF